MTASQQPVFESGFAGQRVLVTGASGFKGSWLSLWLADLGAEVHGVSLAPNTSPNLFEAANVDSRISHTILDIARRDQLIDRILAIDPVFVFHLAAQPLVRRSYLQPLETFETNVLGTAHVLEACRQARSTRAVVCVTTDKVYRNDNRVSVYAEDDPLGGADPYSASKAGAELVAECYQRTLNGQGNGVFMATARGGNIIGGGDWSEDRIVPDFVRAITRAETLRIRNPKSTRPWQHVLSLCHGYLLLARRLADRDEGVIGAWNFGPPPEDCVSVDELLRLFGEHWKEPDIAYQSDSQLHESHMLAIDSTRARISLRWNPPWSLETTVRKTASWYRDYYAAPHEAVQLMREQIAQYRYDVSGYAPLPIT